MQHFFLGEDISGPRVQILGKELLHQMKDVLRFRKGDEFVVLDGFGEKAKGKIEELHSKGAVISLSEHQTCKAPRRRLRLYIALSKKPATFELIAQKATEIGVTDIVPLLTERCQVREIKKNERLHLIIKEAAEQCERCFLPKLHETLGFSEFTIHPPHGLILAGDPWTYDKKLSLVEIPKDKDVNVVIGPEGGLKSEEIEAIRKMGGVLFLLGENVLRMETAAIAALSVVSFS